MKTNRAAGAANRRGIETRRLKHDGFSFFGNFGFVAAHDASKSSRLFRVGNDEFAALSQPVRIVQRMELLTGNGAAGVQNFAGNFFPVISVHWLPEFNHNEIRHVDDVVNRADTGAFEAFLNPFGRRSELNVGENARGKSAAQILRVDFNFNHIGGGFVGIFVDGNFWEIGRLIEQHGGFAH